jgi:hypothetical protein
MSHNSIVRQLDNVAMNGRNVLDYMKLIPGVVSSFDGHASGTGGLDAMNINGTRANQHEFTIDGASNVDTGNNGGTHVTLNTDAIEEVKVLTSNFQAEFGKAAGGQIAIITKGGSNQFHGGARFFHRNEGLNANEWFNKQNQLQGTSSGNTSPLYRYNYVGYQVGGPIKKDKPFFFCWAEPHPFHRGRRQREHLTQQKWNQPAAAISGFRRSIHSGYEPRGPARRQFWRRLSGRNSMEAGEHDD